MDDQAAASASQARMGLSKPKEISFSTFSNKKTGIIYFQSMLLNFSKASFPGDRCTLSELSVSAS